MHNLMSRFHSLTPNPDRDWLILISLSTLLLAAVIVWNVWMLRTAVKGGVIGSSATSNTATFNQSSLDTIHTVFANRAAEEEKYTTGTYSFSDPSQ